MTSHRLAQGLKHYMIHLPMESGNKQFNTQYKTLLTSFSNRQIQSRVHELTSAFSKCTIISTIIQVQFIPIVYEAMSKLYRALRKEGFVFM